MLSGGYGAGARPEARSKPEAGTMVARTRWTAARMEKGGQMWERLRRQNRGDLVMTFCDGGGQGGGRVKVKSGFRVCLAGGAPLP